MRSKQHTSLASNPLYIGVSGLLSECLHKLRFFRNPPVGTRAGSLCRGFLLEHSFLILTLLLILFRVQMYNNKMKVPNFGIQINYRLAEK